MELLAELLPYLTTLAKFAGTDVIHFVDNTSAIYASIKGASSSEDSAQVVHASPRVRGARYMRVVFEYVPSKENIADAPSRDDMELLVGIGAHIIELVFPTPAALASPLAVYAFVQDLVGEEQQPTGGPGAQRVFRASRAARKRRRAD
eukprot:327958-Prymnesium_polylepis.1